MVQYGIPAGLSLRGAIQAIFNFYCSSKDNDKEGDVCMDGTSFVRMCRDAPDLGSAGRIQRYELDLIFSKAKLSLTPCTWLPLMVSASMMVKVHGCDGKEKQHACTASEFSWPPP